MTAFLNEHFLKNELKIFEEWFHEEFVVKARAHLVSIGQKPRAVLIIDNCPAHP